LEEITLTFIHLPPLEPTNRRNIHHSPALLWRFFVILVPDKKTADLLTYLLEHCWRHSVLGLSLHPYVSRIIHKSLLYYKPIVGIFRLWCSLAQRWTD